MLNIEDHEQDSSIYLIECHTTHSCLGKCLDSITPSSSELSLVPYLEEDNNDHNNIGDVTSELFDFTPNQLDILLHIPEVTQQQLMNKDIFPPIDPIFKPFCDATRKLLHELIFESFESTSPNVHVDFSQPTVYDQYDDELNHEVGLQYDHKFSSCFEHTLNIFNTCQNEGYDNLIKSTFLEIVYDNYEENGFINEREIKHINYFLSYPPIYYSYNHCNILPDNHDLNSHFSKHKSYNEENEVSPISNDDTFNQNFEVIASHNDDNAFQLQSLLRYTKELDHNTTSFDLKYVDYFKEYSLYIFNHESEECFFFCNLDRSITTKNSIYIICRLV